MVDFHSFRYTFCTNLHLADVPLREAMELMRHSDAGLTMSIYADSSLFALRPAIEKLPWNCPADDAQRDAQTAQGVFCRHRLAQWEPWQKVKNSQSIWGYRRCPSWCVTECLKIRKWCALQVLNLRPPVCDTGALPLS